MAEQSLRKGKVGGSTPLVGSIIMKFEIKKIWDYLFLDKLSWIFLVSALICNLSLWYIWTYKAHFSDNAMFYSTGVLVVNAILSFIYIKKEIIIPYFLLGTALLVQIFALILLRYTTLIYF